MRTDNDERAPEAAASPTAPGTDAGWYPVPATHGGVVERRWDGDVWTDETRPAAADSSVAPWHRRPLRFLDLPGWLLLVAIVAGSTGAFLLVEIDGGRTIAAGIQWLAVPLALLATAAAMLSLLRLLDHRLRFGQVVAGWAPVIAWGVVSGLVAIAVAYPLEARIAGVLGNFAAGPIEEFAKLLGPVVLWFVGRYRLPRQGLLLVVLSAATFGIAEGGEYAAMPDSFDVMRPLEELQHPLYTGLAAAFAWRAAWGRSRWFTTTGVLAVVAAMALHSVNDGLIGLAGTSPGPVGLVTPTVLLVAYLALRHGARQLVPPDNVRHVSPRWRPIAAPPDRRPTN